MSGVRMIGEKVPCFVNGGERKELGYGQTIYHEFSGSKLPCTRLGRVQEPKALLGQKQI